MASEVPVKCGPGHIVLRPYCPGDMNKRVPFRKSDLGRAIEVAQARGWNSVQLKIGPDGSISVSASKFAPDVASAHKDNLNAVED